MRKNVNYSWGFCSALIQSHFSALAKDVKEYLVYEDSGDFVHLYHIDLRLMPFTDLGLDSANMYVGEYLLIQMVTLNDFADVWKHACQTLIATGASGKMLTWSTEDWH